MHLHQGRKYLDDRLFILDLTGALKGGGKVWAVITRRNCDGFPPFRVDDFETMEGAIAFIREIEPTTPRFSLGEKSPNPTPSYEAYCEWLRVEGIPSSLEIYELNKTTPREIIIDDVQQG